MKKQRLLVRTIKVNVNSSFKKPSYNKELYLESCKTWDDLGIIWKE